MRRLGIIIALLALCCFFYSANLVANENPKVELTTYVDDPDAGLAGVVRFGDKALYFQVRPRSGVSDEPSGRILDASGRLVAVMTSAMELDGDPWLRGQQYLPRVSADTSLATLAIARISDHAFRYAGDRETATLRVLLEAIERTPAAATPLYLTPENLPSLARNQAKDDAVHSAPETEFTEPTSPNIRLNGTFQNSIGFETIQLTVPDVEAPSGVRIETYARFYTPDGLTVATSEGGDDVPAEWAASPADDGLSDRELIDTSLTRIGLVVMATRAAQRQLQSSPEFDADLSALRAIGAAFEEHLLPEWSPGETNESDAPVKPGQFSLRSDASASAYWYKQTISVWSGGIVIQNQLAEHTATLVTSKRSTKKSGPFVAFKTQSLENHGRAWNGDRMKWVKEYTTSAMGSYIPSVGKCSSTKTWFSDCDLTYAVGNKCKSSLAMRTTSHNCHDDALVQFWTIKNGSQYDPCGKQCTNCSILIWTPTSKF